MLSEVKPWPNKTFDTAYRVASVQSPLRTLEYFHPIDGQQTLNSRHLIGDERAIDIRSDARIGVGHGEVAADTAQEGLGKARCAVVHEGWHQELQILRGLDFICRQRGCGYGSHRNRHILQILGPLFGGDHDLFQGRCLCVRGNLPDGPCGGRDVADGRI